MHRVDIGKRFPNAVLSLNLTFETAANYLGEVGTISEYRHSYSYLYSFVLHTLRYLELSNLTNWFNGSVSFENAIHALSMVCFTFILVVGNVGFVGFCLYWWWCFSLLSL